MLQLSACKRDDGEPDDPHDHNEEELITSVELHITESGSGNHFMATWSDLDGAGGESPKIDSIFLDTNSIYSVSIEFLDESDGHAHDLTDEIEEEADEHIICFESATTDLSVNRTDSDGIYEIGLESEWTTKDASSSSIRISLKHQPEVKDGTCTPGETDVEVTFPLVIK